MKKIGDFEAQKKMQEVVKEFGTYLNQLGGQSLQSFNTTFEQYKQTVPNVSPIKNVPISSARVVKDVTFEDGSVIECGSSFTKVWKIKNTGKEAWPVGTSLMYLGGSEELGIPLKSKFTVFIARSDQEVDVSVPMKAPMTPGVLKASFRLVTADGEEFGNKMDLSVVIVKKEALIKEDPLKPTNSVEKWNKELKFLSEMGFVDQKVNIELLEKYSGDLTVVVQKIFEGQ
jgi:hypothetical protein